MSGAILEAVFGLVRKSYIYTSLFAILRDLSSLSALGMNSVNCRGGPCSCSSGCLRSIPGRDSHMASGDTMPLQ